MVRKLILAISATTVVLTSSLCLQGNISAIADDGETNGFESGGTYQAAVLTTDKYDIDGDGNKDSVYEISNAGQLYWFSVESDKKDSLNAVLTQDITVNAGEISENSSNCREWIPICQYGYNGIFDGQGHTVSGLYYKGSAEYVGLFGYNYNGKILNVGVKNSYFNNDRDYSYTGGICGRNEYGTISKCYSFADATGTFDVGGIAGYNQGEIMNCYNAGVVNGESSQYSGGICAFNNGNISDCYNIGTIKFSYSSGGICGTESENIKNCYYLDTCNGNEHGNSFSNKMGTVKTAEKFASGEIAYLLQGEKTENIWGQNIGADKTPVLNGSKVYKNKVYSGCENACGEASFVYSNSKEDDKYAAHNYTKGGVCRYCNALENGKDGFSGISLTLTDGVIMNYYMLLSDDVRNDSGAYIRFTSDSGIDKKVMVSDGVEDVKEDLTRYRYSIELRPDQMTDEITAQVFYGNGEQGRNIKYSVKQYCDNIQSGASHENLAYAMLRYGAYSQIYTGRNTGNMACNVSDYSYNKSIGSEYKYSFSEKISGIEVKSATLLIGSNTTIRIKCRLADNLKISDFDFKCDGQKIEPEQSGDYYYLYVKNIKPQELDKMHDFYFYDSVSKESMTFRYGAFSYMKNVLDKANSDYESADRKIVNLVNAMYDYNYEAKSYINSLY